MSSNCPVIRIGRTWRDWQVLLNLIGTTFHQTLPGEAEGAEEERGQLKTWWWLLAWFARQPIQSSLQWDVLLQYHGQGLSPSSSPVAFFLGGFGNVLQSILLPTRTRWLPLLLLMSFNVYPTFLPQLLARRSNCSSFLSLFSSFGVQKQSVTLISLESFCVSPRSVSTSWFSLRRGFYLEIRWETLNSSWPWIQAMETPGLRISRDSLSSSCPTTTNTH